MNPTLPGSTKLSEHRQRTRELYKSDKVLAAINIQKHFRGLLVRKNVKKNVEPYYRTYKPMITHKELPEEILYQNYDQDLFMERDKYSIINALATKNVTILKQKAKPVNEDEEIEEDIVSQPMYGEETKVNKHKTPQKRTQNQSISSSIPEEIESGTGNAIKT